MPDPKKQNPISQPKISAAKVIVDLKQQIRPDKAKFLPKFFQCKPGGYGEGDRFLGVVVPDCRKIARQYKNLQLNEIKNLLRSKWHEVRFTGLAILTSQFESKSIDSKQRERLLDLYLENLDQVNNWDLVDATSHKILGPVTFENRRLIKLLDKLSRSENLWHQRIAMISTLYWIKRNDYSATLKYANRFLNHSHDLMHKAVGWMLREVGKRDEATLIAYLDSYASKMPSTMLRYAIEKLPKKIRQHYLELKRTD